MDDAQFIQHLEALGATRGLKPSNLWEMSGVERTIWGRIKAKERKASRENFGKLQNLENELKALPLQPANGEAA